jgi:hypothetical protein
MSRFKFGLVLGLVIGWLVTSGKGAELLEQARRRAQAARADAKLAPTDADGVYDFAVRAAAQ